MHLFCTFVHVVGDPILPGVERQSENSSLYLHPGETEPSHHRHQLQAVCTAGRRRRTDLSAQQHIRGGKLVEIYIYIGGSCMLSANRNVGGSSPTSCSRHAAGWATWAKYQTLKLPLMDHRFTCGGVRASIGESA